MLISGSGADSVAVFAESGPRVEHNDYDGAGNAIQGVELHMPKMFGTDGVRGLANRDLTARLALDLGDAAVRVLGDAGTQDDQPEGRRRASWVVTPVCPAIFWLPPCLRAWPPADST